MTSRNYSRRGFLGASAIGAAAMMPAPALAAVQSAGIEPSDLVIKEVKVYIVARELDNRAGSDEKIAAIVTNSGIEGNYTLADRYYHPNWSNLGWRDYAKSVLPGKSVLDLPALTSQWTPTKRRLGQLSYASAIDNCLWDILGKAVGLPVYRLLGAYRDRVRAYASSQHLNTVDDFLGDLQRAKSQGFTAYKIHPPWLADNAVDYKLDIEVAKAVRKQAGDKFPLLFDRVGGYSRDEAMKVGRALDDLGYVSYEDPIPTTDIDGLVELVAALDLPVTIGEFLSSPYNYGEYIRRGALDEVRFIVDNIGGITSGMKVAHLAECFSMECQPHNWGGVFDHAVHFHCELAMPNNVWFEMTQPQGNSDRPYMKDRIRIDKDGYVPAPTKPGLGYEIDRNVLDKMTKSIER
jgi:L-alanine-DL-glutamate epimerase-like enolase superfamily enzyme